MRPLYSRRLQVESRIHEWNANIYANSSQTLIITKVSKFRNI